MAAKSDHGSSNQTTGRLADQFSIATLRETPRYTFVVALIAALGGMLFGYDIGVISGAENLIKADFHLNSTTEEIAVASVLVGAMIGAVFGGRFSDRFSRRWMLFSLAILYAIGAILSALSFGLVSFVVFRIITGIAVGASSLIVPAYIAEMAPTSIRGGLVLFQQLAISGGILISYIVDYLFDAAGWGWRPMFAAAVVPAIGLAVGISLMSYSPRWLGMRGRWDEASGVLRRINPQHHDSELEAIKRDTADGRGTSWRELLRPGLRGALIAGIGLAVFQQFVGPNTVLFYTPTIFGYAGVGGGNPLLPTIWVGVALFVFVIPTIAIVDVIGRKKLFYLGLAGMALMLVLLGTAFAVGARSWGVGVLLILLFYVVFYSLSISPLFWLMSAELFPNRLRGTGSSAASTANWAANLLVTVTFLSLIDLIGKSWTFWLYAILAVLGILFVWRFLPETKGRSLEDVEAYWTNDRTWPEAADQASEDSRSGR